MPTFVGRPPAAGTLPDDTESPPDTTPPPIDEATDYEFGGSTISALQTFLDGVPDGARVGLPEDADITGNGSAALHLASRNGLTIVGRNAHIRRTAQGTGDIFLIDGGGNGFTAYDLWIEGANPNPGVWDEDFEDEHAFHVGGQSNVEFNQCHVLNVGGDGLKMEGGNNKWAKNVRFHHGSIEGNSRMAFSITDGAREVTIDFNTIKLCAYYPFDIEPNSAVVEGIAAGALDVYFQDNSFLDQPYGTDTGGQPVGLAFVITNASGTGPAKRIYFRRNTFAEGAMRVGIFMASEDIFVQNNTAVDTFVSGDPTKCVNFGSHVNRGAITGNVQPCTVDADFLNVSGSVGITTTPNTI